MNKIIMFFWALIIILMLVTILLIGYNKQDKIYLELESNLKQAAKCYVKNNNLKPKISESEIIFVDKLIEGEYIKEDNIKEYCIDSVVYSRGLIIDEYKINIKCEDR